MTNVSELLRLALRADLAVEVSSRMGARLCKSHANRPFLRIEKGADSALFTNLVSCSARNISYGDPLCPVAFNQRKQEAYIAIPPDCTVEQAVAWALLYVECPRDIAALYACYGEPKVLVFDFLLGKDLRRSAIVPISSVAVYRSMVKTVGHLNIASLQ